MGVAPILFFDSLKSISALDVLRPDVLTRIKRLMKKYLFHGLPVKTM
jgi:hypothetical protein